MTDAPDDPLALAEDARAPRRIAASQWGCAGIIAAIAVTSITARVIASQKLEQTSALFIGLPTVLAIALALAPRAKSATGMMIKGVTLFLLSSAILLWEGFICILMAAPLFYLVGISIGLIADVVRKSRLRDKTLAFGPAVALLAAMSLEGTTPRLSFPRAETVTVERVVACRPIEVEQRLAAPPRLDRPLPPFLRLRFPRPHGAYGRGLALGDKRIVRFGATGEPPQELVAEVMARTPRSARLRIVKDDSMVGMWLLWREASIAWDEVPGGTRVRLTLRYDRMLDPAWYFGPAERYGARLAAGYFLEGVAEPRADGGR